MEGQQMRPELDDKETTSTARPEPADSARCICYPGCNGMGCEPACPVCNGAED